VIVGNLESLLQVVTTQAQKTALLVEMDVRAVLAEVLVALELALYMMDTVLGVVVPVLPGHLAPVHI
jgi:hypothetical protein